MLYESYLPPEYTPACHAADACPRYLAECQTLADRALRDILAHVIAAEDPDNTSAADRAHHRAGLVAACVGLAHLAGQCYQPMIGPALENLPAPQLAELMTSARTSDV